MADPKLVQMIVKAAQSTGADPRALLATALQESGARFGAVGDQGTSFGPFQFHKGGALGSHDASWANSYEAILNRAQEFKRLGVHGGVGAAAVQRPADRAGYAKGVQGHLGQASEILGMKISQDGQHSQPPVPSEAPQTASPAIAAAGQVNTLSGPLQMLAGLSQSTSNLLGGNPAQQTGLSSLIGSMPQPPTAPPLPSESSNVKLTKQAKDQGAVPADGQPVVAAAEKYLGTPYLWGGTDPKKGLDCSGLVQLAVKQATGQTIPRVAADQYHASKKVPTDQMRPGDIVAFGTPDNVHHIGIYVGNGNYIQSPHTGDKVKISALKDRNDLVGAGRFS